MLGQGYLWNWTFAHLKGLRYHSTHVYIKRRLPAYIWTLEQCKNHVMWFCRSKQNPFTLDNVRWILLIEKISYKRKHKRHRNIEIVKISWEGVRKCWKLRKQNFQVTKTIASSGAKENFGRAEFSLPLLQRLANKRGKGRIAAAYKRWILSFFTSKLLMRRRVTDWSFSTLYSSNSDSLVSPTVVRASTLFCSMLTCVPRIFIWTLFSLSSSYSLFSLGPVLWNPPFKKGDEPIPIIDFSSIHKYIIVKYEKWRKTEIMGSWR